LGFTRIIAISYSAFDGFELPGLTRAEREQMARDVSTGTGRYVFCGLRDIVSEFSEMANNASDKQERVPPERTEKTKLKTLGALADEFTRTLAHIRAANDMDVLEDVTSPILRDPSFGLSTPDLAAVLGDNPREAFLGWSTGHKIVMHVAAAMTAHVQPRSLVLFDEPETHLHPPLLAAFMHTFRALLKRRSALAIVATHSPVVLQETLAQHIHVIRREGMITTASHTDIETFGENVGTITHSVFDLTSEVTDFHHILDALCERGATLEQLEANFPIGLSQQARAYVMMQLARRTAGA
jgi:energy-coupling factor transporter ATP-binding protein EcfA2